MTVPAVTAPFLASAALLVGAGGAKLWRPDDTARALRAAGLPAHRRLVRLGALAELIVAVASVVAPGPLTGALVAAVYAAFTAFVGTALLRGWPISSCGCFGRPDTRPGLPHLTLDAAATVVATWWAAVAPHHIDRLLTPSPWHGWPLAFVAAVVAGLAYMVWTNPLERAAR